MRWSLLCLLLLPLAARAGEGEDTARFAEAMKEYRGIEKSTIWSEVKRRRDLLQEIARLDCPDALPVLYRAFTQDREPICRLPAMRGLARATKPKAVRMMVKAALRDKNDLYVMDLPEALADCRAGEIGPWIATTLLPHARGALPRAALVQALGRMRCADGFEPILAIVKDDSRDVRTTYESMIALARIDGARALPLLLPYLKDRDPSIRKGAVVALDETGLDAAVDSALPLADDESPGVQEAVAELIGHRKAVRGVPVLLRLLCCGRLRVMDAARAALEAMTGQSLGLDLGAWQRWFQDRAAGRPPRPKKPDGMASVATYYGMQILSDRILFVLDISGSMKQGTPPRMETARTELETTLGRLSGKTVFNIVAFSGSPMWWKNAGVPATKENVANAESFVEKLTPGGRTNVYDTLEQAIEQHRSVDTIYFLGDGSPSVGRVTGQEEILARIRWMNRLRGIRIHTIALLRGAPLTLPGTGGKATSREEDPAEAARFMARLAALTGGTFLRIQ